MADAAGSYVYIYDALKLVVLKTFFLGYTARTFKAIIISPHMKNISCLSSSGTLHLFEIEGTEGHSQGRTSFLLVLTSMTGYLKGVKKEAKIETRFKAAKQIEEGTLE